MKTFELNHGLRLTESKDMGIFLHFKKKDGLSDGGICLHMAGNDWAKELLAGVEYFPEPDDDEHE